MDRTAKFYAYPSYVGGGLPIYSGSRRQRGGSVLGAIKRFFMPILGKLAKRGAVSALDFAKGVATDAFTGKNIKESLKTRGINQVKRLGSDTLHDVANQLGSGRRRKATASSRKRARSRKATASSRKRARSRNATASSRKRARSRKATASSRKRTRSHKAKQRSKRRKTNY